MPVRSLVQNVLGFFLLGMILVSCQTSDVNSSEESNETRKSYPLEQPLVEEKYKLNQPQPVETPTELDEKSFINDLFKDPKKEPSQIRSLFDKAVRKKRDLFKKDKDKQRSEFSKNERKRRQDVLKSLELERNEFKKSSATKEQSREFFQKQDEKRKTFFTEEREARAEFESEMRDRQKNFEDYMRDKSNEFNAELKIFNQNRKDLLSNK